MQQEIAADSLAAAAGVPISILGVNEPGAASASAQMWAGRHVPLLQDNAEQDVWHGRWRVAYRDVVVLGAENDRLFVYNLTQHDLNDPANYADLKARLLAAAGRPGP